MDWPNERYVRLYVRDTTSWKRLGWHGQNMLMQILRKLDRSGTLDLGGLDAWEAAMLHTGAPEEEARAGVEKLLHVGVATLVSGRLVFPNYIEAQECVKSEALRAREYRERRAAGASVTNSDEPASQNVMPASQIAQARHGSSQLVTLNSAVPSLAVPSLSSSAPLLASPAASAAPRARKPKGKAAALVELEAALREELAKRQDTPPALSNSQAAKACARIREYASQHGVSEGDAARVLAASYASSGHANAWKLLDVPMRPAGAPAAPQASYGGRMPKTLGTTGKDFEDAEPIEVQIARMSR